MLCKVVYEFYDQDWVDTNVSIRLDNLLSRKKFPMPTARKLTYLNLESCFGFVDIDLVGFQGDKKSTNVHPFTKENFIEYEYSNANKCFVYYSLQNDPRMTLNVRLDHLLNRSC